MCINYFIDFYEFDFKKLTIIPLKIEISMILIDINLFYLSLINFILHNLNEKICLNFINFFKWKLYLAIVLILVLVNLYQIIYIA